MIDICMTATIRPKVVSQTLESFCKNLFIDRDNYRLIINVDPIGEENVSREEVINVCKNYFKQVVYNFPKRPSFPEAVRWIWSRADSDFIFHLEDDWILISKLNINDMVRILAENKRIASLRLSKFKILNLSKIRLWGTSYFHTGDNFYITESNNQFGLNPVLIKKEFVKAAVPLLSSSINPEKQFRPSKNEKMNNLIDSWKYAIYAIPGSRATVVDIGPTWKDVHRFKKPVGTFLVWEKC